MTDRSPYIRVLSIDPCPKGFGFVVVESRPRLLDWGVARVWASSDAEYVARVACLVDRYRAEAIVIEALDSSRRSPRMRERLVLLAKYFARRDIQLIRVARSSAQALLLGERVTKRAVALRIAEIFPELIPHVPPPRKPWMTEDDRMSIFDAAALALASRV